MSKEKRVKEWNELQKLKVENKKLRRENSKLRKVIKNVDFERYNYVQDLLTSIEYDDQESVKKLKNSAENKWKCHDCADGKLKLIILFKLNQEYYFRKCNICGKQTKLKKYTSDVESDN